MSVAALVLAAGKSTRIEPLARGRPKPLLEVGGRSLLEWNLLWLAEHGVERVWINLHYEGESIRRVIGSGARLGVSVRYSEEPTLLGTAGAWRRLEAEWKRTSLVVYGDNLMRFDLERLLDAHRSHGGAATIALFNPTHHANTGIAGGRAVMRADGRIESFKEGDGAGVGLVNAGVYVLEPEVRDVIGTGHQDFGHDVLPQLAAAGSLGGHAIEADGFCLGLDTPERYAIARDLVANGAVTL